MPLSDAQETILAELSATLDGSQWCVFGSVDTVLRGLEDDPADVDVLATEGAAERIRDLYRDEFVETTEVGRSQIDEYRVGGEELEVIYSASEKSHQEPLVDLETVELESSGDPAVPRLPLSVIVEAYRTIDKHETARRLEAQFGLPD